MASNAALAQESTPAVVYNNTTTSLFEAANFLNQEYGDQIWLDSPVIADGIHAGNLAREITKVEFEYFAQDVGANDTISFSIYDYEPGNPNTVNGGAPLATVADIVLVDGFNTVTLDFVGDNAVTVRDSLTWTVNFNVADPNTTSAGLSFYSPATVSGNAPARVDDFWQKNTGPINDGWESVAIQGGPAGNFGARFTAVPEPSVIVLGFLAGVSFLGMRSMRRRNG